jgi:hypothetical protein
MLLWRVLHGANGNYTEFAYEKDGEAIDFAKSIGATAPQLIERQTPEPEAEPDWQGFQDALDVTERGGNGLFGLFLYLSEATAWAAYNLVRDFAQGRAAHKELLTLHYLYSQLFAKLGASEQALLNQTLVDHNIPISQL